MSRFPCLIATLLLTASASFPTAATAAALPARSASFFKMEGQSMEPTIHKGEIVRVSKTAYRHQAPQRGDVIVFRAVPAGQPHRYFIKRVIGLPGETVAIRNQAVFINGRRLPESYIREAALYVFPSETIPQGSYFVLGDNRNNSFDSSKWPSAWLPYRDIVGKALLPHLSRGSRA